jgi:type I restriction enzyme S subunit
MYGEGRTRGRCAELAIDATCNQACAAILLRDELQVFRHFVWLFFDASYESNRRLASGGVQPNLNVGLIKRIAMPLPPVPEAKRIVAEVDRQFSFIEACEHAVDAGLARSAALRRSALKAAFEGRLVPQDLSDEPASALLERLRAERSALTAPAKPLRLRRSVS